MTPALAAAVAVGILLGLGLWTLASLVPAMARPRLLARVVPHVLDVSSEARALVARRPSEPSPLLGLLIGSPVQRMRRALTVVLGGDEAVRRRLRQAGEQRGAEDFRSRQLAWAAAGAVVGILVAAILGRTGSAPPLVQLGIVPLAAGVGLLLPERMLLRASRARLRRMTDELPTVLEFLTLALSAGESLPDALRRVARVGVGELAREISAVVAEVNTGVALAPALQRCAAAVDLPALTRCVEQLVPALERGSPLVEVLRAQAQDAREDAKRNLIEAAGRKEIAMLVPLVFLILPVTILFAIYPGVLVLQLGF